MQDRWIDRLSEFLDGQLTEREAVELEWHLQSCLECRRTLAELRKVVERARALPEREPVNELWPAIAARLESSPRVDLASLKVIDLRTQRASRSVRRISFTMPQLAAASLALMLLSGTIVWFALGRSAGLGADSPAPGTPVRQVSDAGQPEDYAAAMKSLETALRQQRNQLDPVTIAILEENLRTIDAAITEARAALARDPGNLYLNQHLENTMKKRIQLLRRATGLRGARS
ncbi:MAG: anti-sigma factor family protein [Longimicrobiales bacterium]